MRYKNTKTGAIIDSSSKIVGKNWLEMSSENVAVEEPKEEYIEEEIDLEAMTKEQLINFAKDHDIEVNETDKKADIIETIAKAFE